MAQNILPSYSKKIIIFLIFLIVVYGIYWLWQRQPRLRQDENSTQTAPTAQNAEQENSKFKPQNFAVIHDQKIKIEGKLDKDSIVAIYTNANQDIVKTTSDGKFSKELELSNGINQVALVNISADYQNQISAQTLNYYLENKGDSTYFYPGSVKNIFGNLITVDTNLGDQKVRTEKSTIFKIPKDEEDNSSTSSALGSIRIGDYAIAVGKTDKEGLLTASILEIIRENKPQISKNISLVVVSSLKNNLLNVRESAKNLEITTSKNMPVYLSGNNAKLADVKKDQVAILFWHEALGKKIADAIYIK